MPDRVQIARAAQSMSDGFRVLSDTRAAEICYTGGQYRLGQELEAAGTVPEYAHGKRNAASKAKAIRSMLGSRRNSANSPFAISSALTQKR